LANGPSGGILVIKLNLSPIGNVPIGQLPLIS
jgi:hypothetical protein